MAQLFDCESGFGQFSIDRQNQVEGNACLSYTFRAGTESFANQVKFDPIDATGADTLAMELYVSDPSMFQHFSQLCLEITSSGTCDHQENAWMMQVQLTAKPLKEGWNTVYFYLSESSETDGRCDLSAINYIRLFGFFDGNKLAGKTIKIDDIRMIYTGGYDYSDVISEMDYYKGNNEDVDIKIAGQAAPDLAHRHEGMTVIGE